MYALQRIGSKYWTFSVCNILLEWVSYGNVFGKAAVTSLQYKHQSVVEHIIGVDAAFASTSAGGNVVVVVAIFVVLIQYYVKTE